MDPGIVLDLHAFLIGNDFSAQAQMLRSEIKNSLKLALPYLTKMCLKYYLEREFQSLVLNIFHIWQISA